jgi:hypothetical protein
MVDAECQLWNFLTDRKLLDPPCDANREVWNLATNTPFGSKPTRSEIVRVFQVGLAKAGRRLLLAWLCVNFSRLPEGTLTAAQVEAAFRKVMPRTVCPHQGFVAMADDMNFARSQPVVIRTITRCEPADLSQQTKEFLARSGTSWENMAECWTVKEHRVE